MISEKHLNKSFLTWVLIALVIRVIIMPFTMHADIISINYFSSKLAYEGIFSIYNYAKDNISLSKVWWGWSPYPPLGFLIPAFFQFILRPFNPHFLNWINLVFAKGAAFYFQNRGPSIEVFRFLFFMKLPYLVFDIFCILTILKFFKKETDKLRALKIWALCPVFLYGVYMMGQIDIIVSFLVTISVLLIIERKNMLGFLFLSLGALCKTSPLFLIPPLMILSIRSKADFYKSIIALSVPVLFIFLPYYISSRGYVITSLFFILYTPNRVESSCLAIGGLAFLFFYFYLIFHCLINRMNKKDIDSFNIIMATLFFVYIIFPFVPVHRFTWIIPIYIVAIVRKKLPLWIYNLQIVLLFLSSLNSASTTSRLFVPINPQFFYNLPGLPDLMHIFSIRWGAVILLSRMLFALTCLLMGMKLVGMLPNKKSVYEK